MESLRCNKSPSRRYFLQRESKLPSVTFGAVIKGFFRLCLISCTLQLLSSLLARHVYKRAVLLPSRCQLAELPGAAGCLMASPSHTHICWSPCSQPRAAPHTLLETFPLPLSHTLSELYTFPLLSHLLVTSQRCWQ